MNDIGLRTVEGVASGITPFTEVAKRNIGLAFESTRGVPNVAVNVTSLSEATKRFGGYNADMYGPTVMRNLFKNALGFPVNLYGVRIVGSGTTVSTVTETIPGGVVELTVTAGQLGEEDPGDWANDDLVCYFYNYNYKTSNKFAFEVWYKDVLVEYYENALCADLEADVNANSYYVVISFTAEPATDDANQTGTGTITTLSAAVAETLATATFTISAIGVDGNVLKIVANGTLLGTYTKVIGDTTPTLVATAVKAAINGGAHGYAASGSGANITITAPVGSGASANGRELSSVITGTIACTGLPDTFSGGVDAVPAALSTTVTGSGTAFNTQLAVGSALYDANDNLIGIVAAIGGATSLTLEDTALLELSGAAFNYSLYSAVELALTGGSYTAPVESDFYPVASPTSPKGLACFDGVDVQIIGVTEFQTVGMATKGRDYCADDHRKLFVAVMPYNASDTIAQQFTALQTSGISDIAVYNAWAKTSDDATGYVWVPALGHVLGGGFIRVPAINGDYINIPPAGYESYFVDCIEVTPSNLSQARLNTYTRSHRINSIAYKKGVGYFIMTSRTMSTNVLFESIHIRLQTSFYARMLEENLGAKIQKPNTPELKRELYVATYAYFKPEYERGALERSISFEDACTIICDQRNNPTTQPRKDLNLDVEWIPTECAEAIKIALNRNDGALIAKIVNA